MGQIEPGDRKEMLLAGILNGDTETNIEPGDREEMLLAGILSGATESNIEPGSRKEALLKAILENGGGGGGGGKVEESWHQCPEAVRNYLAAASEEYDPSDYTETVIDDFAPSTAVSSNTKPVGKTVDGVTFRNNVPNVDEPFATANKAGTLTALDSLRWVNTADTMNVRDLGGWACDGGTVRYGMLFRGGLPNVNDKELMVDVMGVRHELDLRGSESEQTESVWGIGYTVFDSYAWYDISNKALWRKIIGTIFDRVNKNVPLYFHCSAGADRTGTVACVIEAILGVSQTDIDIDYELTTFATGSYSADTTRARNEDSWTGLIGAIKAVALPSGVSDTFRNHAIYFVASLGFTADEINAFRSAMIDGEPDTITLDLDGYTVTKTLTNVTATGGASVDEYQPFVSELTPANGCLISGVTVTMGGADITSQVFKGTKKQRLVYVTNVLTNCSVSNQAIKVEYGASYVSEITADTGYTMDSVTITMGGIDVSNYYSDGKIAIEQVTGDIVVTATAVSSAPSYTNLADPTSADWLTGYRLNSSAAPTELSGNTVTNIVPCQAGDTIRIKNMSNLRSDSAGANVVNGLKADKTKDFSIAYSGSTGAIASMTYDTDKQLGTVVLSSGATATKYIRFSAAISPGKTASDVIITVNEEID